MRKRQEEITHEDQKHLKTGASSVRAYETEKGKSVIKRVAKKAGKEIVQLEQDAVDLKNKIWKSILGKD